MFGWKALCAGKNEANLQGLYSLIMKGSACHDGSFLGGQGPLKSKKHHEQRITCRYGRKR